jgi:hypothetical protein
MRLPKAAGIPKVAAAKAVGIPKASAAPAVKLSAPPRQVRAPRVPNFARPSRISQLVEPHRPHPAKNLGPYLHPPKPKM